MFQVGDIVVSDPENLKIFYRVEVLKSYNEYGDRIDGLILECEDGCCFKPGDHLNSIQARYFKFEHISPYEQLLLSLNNLEKKLS